jgi:NitT/TauT family transport system ATP-binding protein
MQTLVLDAVDKRFATGVWALRAASLAIEAGEFVALLGPSGCGKSTALRLLAGLEAPTQGAVHVDRDATMSVVFQDPTLMPWSNVFDNVWLPLRIAGMSRAAARERIEPLLQAVGLAGFEDAFPNELSGGMKMRASIARALVTRPSVLLMDEPFAALDEITRYRLNDDLLAWWRAHRLTVLFVTHSVFEAVYLSQRVLVMGARPGRVTADIAIDEPYPRAPVWRTSVRYAQRAHAVSEALEAASSEAA